MKAKGFIATFLTVFFIAATALAGGPANMKTDVPTIPEADCDQAGWISLEVGSGFDLHEGDQIVWSTTNNVPLCKDINIFMSIADLAGANLYPQTNISAIFTTNAANSIDITGNALDLVGGVLANAAGDSWEAGFLIVGNSGSNRITLTFTRRWVTAVTNAYAVGNTTGNYAGMIGLGNDGAGGVVGNLGYIMTFNVNAGAPTDVCTIRLFDSNNDVFASNTNAGFFEKETAAPFGYVDTIEPQDNVLCLDTNNDATLVNGQYVWATPDSQPGIVAGASQVSFSGDYTIANISGSEGYATSTVGKGQCETVSIGATFDQFGNPIGDEATLDVGNYTGGLAGACTGSRWADQVGSCEEGDGYGILITKSGNFQIADSFSLRLSLAVSTDGGNTYTDINMDNAWFNSNGSVFETMASNIGNIQCDADAAVASALSLADNNGNAGFTNTDGDNYILQADYATVQGNTYDSFLLDVGQISYLKSAFDDGDIIALKVELWKFPCGLVETDYICLATAVDACSTGAGPTTTISFPYGVGADNTAFWTGIAITNTTDTDGTATVTFYGTEGGVSTYDIAVGARDIENFSMSNVMDLLTGTLTGAENFQAVVTADVAIDGIMFIGGRGTNTVLHGYLPRQR